jgi:hypothetical protein
MLKLAATVKRLVSISIKLATSATSAWLTPKTLYLIPRTPSLKFMHFQLKNKVPKLDRRFEPAGFHLIP